MNRRSMKKIICIGVALLTVILLSANVFAATIPQSQMKVKVNSENKDYSASLAIDGKPDTLWHTEWEGTPPKPPHYMIVDLGGKYRINKVTYLPRQGTFGTGGNENGRFKKVNLYVSADGKKFKKVAAANWDTKVDTLQTIELKPVSAAFIKLEAVEVQAASDGTLYGSCAELNVEGEPDNGAAAEEPAAEAADAQANPKTGDPGGLVYVLLAGAALAGGVISVRSRRK